MPKYFKDIHTSIGDTKSMNTFDRSLHYTIGNHTNEKVYRRGMNLPNTHWGQLKLFTSELVFLTHYYDQTEVSDLVYVGAAPGEHIVPLSKMFPTIKFHLFDKNDFDGRLNQCKNVEINKRYFDEEDIKMWKTKACLFISDIRTLSYDSSKTKIEDMKKNEDIVWEDMNLQRAWVEEIKPRYSLLKFRLPYAEKFELEKGKTRDYLDGIVYIQPFCKPVSSETRLCVPGKQITERKWDIVSYERKLFHHNFTTRHKTKFTNPFTKNMKHIYQEVGLYNDFDSVYLAHVVMEYMNKVGKLATEESVQKILKFIVENVACDRKLTDIRKN